MFNTRILIVDDMSSMRGVIKMFLTEGGFHNLTEASNGQTALSLLKTQKFDLVICDWDMPGMTGLELLEQMKKEENLMKIPFIMLTATSRQEKVQKAIELGVNDYISKPFQPQRLLGKLVKIINITGTAQK
ncbi:MAG: response regulator [Gammaproteobacteria bacterium]|nr:response regulator [Gammaproteobacteria bacterium]